MTAEAVVARRSRKERGLSRRMLPENRIEMKGLLIHHPVPGCGQVSMRERPLQVAAAHQCLWRVLGGKRPAFARFIFPAPAWECVVRPA